ncbi:OB-fold nucleic acid binding domain-containing protein [Nanoarchaeota archaeon]
MKEKSLFKISLMGAVLGIFILYIVSLQLGVDEVRINELDEVEDEENVKIRGVISRVSNQDKVAFLEVAQEEVETVTVVLFKDENVSLSEGDFVEIEGSVETYLGEKEIIGNRVEVK